MHPPLITILANGTLFNFKEHMITITTHRIKVGDSGNIAGEIDIESTRPVTTPDVFYGRVNFLSLSGKESLIRHLNKVVIDVPWHELIEAVSRHTIKTTRRAGQLTEINSNEEVPDVQFMAFPFIQDSQPTTLFGDGASGKSYIALLLAIAVKLGWSDNTLGIKLDKQEGAEVVWLDYETCETDFRRRLKKLTEGLGLGFCSIYYRRCVQNIATEIDELSVLVNSQNPGLVVIDSIGAACAGDLHGSESPTLFFNAIRRISGAKLLLFHSNKEKELYGNRFFWNFSRHVWEIKKQQAPGQDQLSVGLFHRKANETQLYEPRAFKFVFNANSTRVENEDILDIPEMAESLSIRQRVRGLLKHGSFSLDEIAEELDKEKASIRKALDRGKDIFVQTPDKKWGLLQVETSTNVE